MAAAKDFTPATVQVSFIVPPPTPVPSPRPPAILAPGQQTVRVSFTVGTPSP
jgi:hypothetical protein